MTKASEIMYRWVTDKLANEKVFICKADFQNVHWNNIFTKHNKNSETCTFINWKTEYR